MFFVKSSSIHNYTMFSLRIRKVYASSPKLLNNYINFRVGRSISGRSSRGHPLQLEDPFPYEEKKFRFYHALFDNTILRMEEENAKIIVVEGPIAAGKTAFAKALAEELDMFHIPEGTMDYLYTLPSGYNLKQHDHELPKICRSFDYKDFCIDPFDVRTGLYQLAMLTVRFFQYYDAMAHLLNTGQGVVLERCYFSDYIFTKAMYDNKFISKNVYNAYFEKKRNTSTFLFPPHLLIYLDIPVPVVQERIRTRNYSHEQNSPALTKKYLESLENYWKKDYLKVMSKYCEILVYDWSDGGDVELIVEDIEKINFDNCRPDGKFEFWQITRLDLYNLRRRFTNKKNEMLKYHSMNIEQLPEFDIPAYKYIPVINMLSKIPECRYDAGYNRLMGDSFFSILFKTKEEKHRLLKHYLVDDNKLE